MESAGVAFAKGDLRRMRRVITLSRHVMANIRQNLLFAWVTKRSECDCGWGFVRGVRSAAPDRGESRDELVVGFGDYECV
jgi:hypothetical protein